MPKVVDHDARRAELGAAVWRLASREGLDAVTVRRVAAEAGWSTGGLVHYFAGKEELLLFAFRTVAERVSRRVTAAGVAGTEPAELLALTLMQALPLDRERRAETRVWFAFLGLALTRTSLARAQREAYRDWRALIAELLREAQDQRQVDAALDCEREAAGLVALVDGLAVQAMFEPRAFPAARQRELVEERLARLRLASRR